MIRIVVADDNEVLLEHIVKGLKESDKLEVVGIANDGEKELKHIMQFAPDVVITDIEMPKKTGIEVIEIVKDFEKIPEFIVITGGASIDIMKKLYSLPVKNIYNKPVDIEKLVNEIESITEIESREETIESKLTEESNVLKKIVNFFKK
ncbi:MAG: response regulator [Clostridia bacterium]|nr:response regulator [Clostridia bacterium]